MRRLHDAISNVCPILGVSVGTPGEVSSVVIAFDPSAQPEQVIEAYDVVDQFDWSAEAEQAWEVGQRMARAGQLLLDVDPVVAGIRCTLRVIVDHVNEQFRLAGLQPLLEPDLVARVQAGLANGLGLVSRPDV